MSDAGEFEQDELAAAAMQSALLNLWVSEPGIVVSYDDTKKTATVQPAVKRPIEREDGTLVYETAPAIKNVPIGHWGSSGLSSNSVLAEGDAVVLLWFDYSPALWRKKGSVAEPADTRKNGPGYPVAFPWWRPSGGPGEETGNSIGKPGGERLTFEEAFVRAGAGASFVALATQVDAELAALKVILQAVASALAAAAIEPACVTAASALTSGLSSWPSGSTASGNLKAD